MTGISTLRKVSLVSFCLVSTPSFAECWTSIGAAGVVDERSQQDVALGIVGCELLAGEAAPLTVGEIFCEQDPMVSLRHDARADMTHVVRYNIDSSGITALNLPVLYAHVHVTDPAVDRVVVLLKAIDLRPELDPVPDDREPIKTIEVLDTRTEQIGPGSFVTISSSFPEFPGIHYAYYVDVLLSTERAPQPDPVAAPVDVTGPAVAWLSVCIPGGVQ